MKIQTESRVGCRAMKTVVNRILGKEVQHRRQQESNRIL